MYAAAVDACFYLLDAAGALAAAHRAADVPRAASGAAPRCLGHRLDRGRHGADVAGEPGASWLRTGVDALDRPDLDGPEPDWASPACSTSGRPEPRGTSSTTPSRAADGAGCWDSCRTSCSTWRAATRRPTAGRTPTRRTARPSSWPASSGSSPSSGPRSPGWPWFAPGRAGRRSAGASPPRRRRWGWAATCAWSLRGRGSRSPSSTSRSATWVPRSPASRRWRTCSTTSGWATLPVARPRARRGPAARGRAGAGRRLDAAFQERAVRKGQSWSLARAARSGALLAGDDDLDERFGEALRLHAAGSDTFEQARTLMSYGARLRRARRRVDARVHLEEARAAFRRARSQALVGRRRGRAGSHRAARPLPHERSCAGPHAPGAADRAAARGEGGRRGRRPPPSSSAPRRSSTT